MRRALRILILFGWASCGAAGASAAESDLPAFPGAKGAGACTPGGRGGKVYLVTTPADYAPGKEAPIPGSLRAAIDAEGPRIVEGARTGAGKVVKSLDDLGGWPEYRKADPPPDSDSDGMPDEWEKKHGLNPNDASDNVTDADGDGYTNIEEYINDTDPRVPEKPVSRNSR